MSFIITFLLWFIALLIYYTKLINRYGMRKATIKFWLLVMAISILIVSINSIMEAV